MLLPVAGSLTDDWQSVSRLRRPSECARQAESWPGPTLALLVARLSTLYIYRAATPVCRQRRPLRPVNQPSVISLLTAAR